MQMLRKQYSTNRWRALLALPLVFLSAGAVRALQADGNANGNANGLGSRVDAVIASGPAANAQWGIAVMDVATGDMIHSRQADRPFVPASGLKLVVAATATHVLGPSFRYTTTLFAGGPVSDGVLRGDLVIHGTGDPTISGRYTNSTTAIFAAFADSLKQRGIRRIDGGIVVDESEWDETYVHADWEPYDLLWWYAAPVAPLGFNNNSIDFRVEPGRVGQPARITWVPETNFFAFSNNTMTVEAGQPKTLDFDRVAGTNTIVAEGDIPVDATPRTEYFAVGDAARFAGTVLREVLEAEGIEVGSDEVSVVQSSPATEMVLARHQSPPLDSIIKPILVRSQNWFAEQLLKTLGREKRDEGTWDAGLAVEREFLIEVVGLDASEFELRDGSGLSERNMITPAGLAKLMRYIERTPEQAIVRDAMPGPGDASPSLNDRLTELRGRLRVKTGSVRDVATLTGVATTTDGRELAFAIMANDTGVPTSASTETIDEIVRVIAEMR